MTNEEIAVMIQRGHEELYPELWENVRGIIFFYAIRVYRNISEARGNIIELEDLTQSSYFALVEAVKYYDPEGEYKFTTYLTKCLKTAFAEAGGWQKKHRDLIEDAFSLNMPLSDDSEDEYIDYLPDQRDDIQDAEDRIFNEELRHALDKAIAALGLRNSEAIYKHYIAGQTLEKIGEDAGVSINAVRNWERDSFLKLRRNKNLVGFIDQLTNFYRRVGIQTFNSTQTSAVECLVLERERLRNTFS